MGALPRAGHREQELGEGQGITRGTELGPPMQIRKGMCFQERFQQSYPLDQLEVTEAEQGQLSFSLLPPVPLVPGASAAGRAGCQCPCPGILLEAGGPQASGSSCWVRESTARTPLGQESNQVTRDGPTLPPCTSHLRSHFLLPSHGISSPWPDLAVTALLSLEELR